MTDALSLTIDDIMQPGIKVLDGIAGAAKTSRVVQLLQEEGIDYLHLTSTNRLKRDISARFRRPAQTIASALFQNEGGRFYSGEKLPESKTLVIDEILQTSTAVFRWIERNRDKYNIVICTDSKQMLSPGAGSSCLKKLDAMKESSINFQFDVTHRPVTPWTKEVYEKLYHSESDTRSAFMDILGHTDFYSASFDEIPDYKSSNVYLCHSNDIEKRLYKEYSLESRYDIDLIPKGKIATEEVKDITKYPILPQIDAKGGIGYWQAANVGSVVRYQGSEVQQGDNLYYFIDTHSIPTNRELYTLVTRAKDFHSLHIIYVTMADERDIILTSFMGCPIIKQKAYIDDDFHPKDLKEVNTRLYDINMDRQDIYYNDIICCGKSVRQPFMPPLPEKAKINAWTIASKTPSLALTKPNLFLKQIEDTGYRGPLMTPLNPDLRKNYQIPAGPNFVQYGIDLYSAYIYCWYNYGLPDGTTYRTDASGEVKLYLVTKTGFLKAGTIITDALYHELRSYSPIYFDAAFIGSIDKLPLSQDKYRDIAMDMATRSIESKKEIKKIQWGWFQKPYIRVGKTHENGSPKAYIISEGDTYQMVMVFIQSELCRVVLEMKKATGSIFEGTTTTDCLYIKRASRLSEEKAEVPDWLRGIAGSIDSRSEIEELGDHIKEAIPGYHFRIFESVPKKKDSEARVLYKTYPDLQPESDVKKALHRERQQRYRSKKQREKSIS